MIDARPRGCGGTEKPAMASPALPPVPRGCRRMGSIFVMRTARTAGESPALPPAGRETSKNGEMKAMLLCRGSSIPIQDHRVDCGSGFAVTAKRRGDPCDRPLGRRVFGQTQGSPLRDTCPSRRGTSIKCFTLVELLIVVAVIAILLAILLPALSTARSYAQQIACGSRLRSLGQAMQNYSLSFDDWLPGSPNTSGNGANPGGKGRAVYGGYYQWDQQQDAFPAVHIFDWASPLLEIMQGSVPTDVPQRYDQSKRWAFRCPSNRHLAKLNHATRINIETIVSSYATCRYLTYVPTSKQTGTGPGTLFWAHPFVPNDFLPKTSHLTSPANKLFLADACKIDRGNPNMISNQEYGYTTHGAWLNEDDASSESPSLSYRFEPARSKAFRHRNGINMLFFDGHVQHNQEGSNETNDGYGSGAREVRFWFPSGTDTGNLPNHASFNNRDLIVP